MEYHSEYDTTVSTSRQESMAKAVELLMAELEQNKKPPVTRPKVAFGRIALCNVAWWVLIIAAYFLTGLLPVSGALRIWSTVGFAFLMTVIHARRIIIALVQIYQRFAPESVRSACVFEPSCSQYMIMAVEKYGPFRGAWKGLRRLCRCHYPNSGIDYP